MFILVNDVHPSNALFSILVPLVITTVFNASFFTELHAIAGIVAVSIGQSANAYEPMLVTPLPIVTLVNDVHPSNAEPPILVTLSGMIILVNDVHPLNAEEPILVPLVIVTVFYTRYTVGDSYTR